MSIVRRLELVAGIVAVLTMVTVVSAAAKQGSVRDPKGDTRLLKKKPELDIVRAGVSKGRGDRVVHKIRMRGKLKPGRPNTRPLLLINTRGNKASKFEYLISGRRVLKRVTDGRKEGVDSFEKVASARLKSRRRTWIYRFKPSGLDAGASYGWAALTSKGKTTDLAPDRRYKTFSLRGR